VLTPLLQGSLDHPVYGPAVRDFPIPTGGFGTPEQIASAVAFLLSPEAAFCCGSVLFVDGGTDALVRPDTY
jgi:NAD(P)-dependent dehydrogenase (short-subunit alcohol dehydrogenase family)